MYVSDRKKEQCYKVIAMLEDVNNMDLAIEMAFSQDIEYYVLVLLENDIIRNYKTIHENISSLGDFSKTHYVKPDSYKDIKEASVEVKFLNQFADKIRERIFKNW